MGDIGQNLKGVIYTTQKQFSLVAGVIFGIVFVLHAMRLVFSWAAKIAQWMVPAWMSWVALVVSSYLAYTGFKLRR